MGNRFAITLFFALSYVSVFAQTASEEVHLNDSTYIYYFDLFDEKRVMQWGTTPKNFPFTNYRVYLKNNSSDTLKIGRVTTGDGRVTYHYDSRTRIIYPNEYVVLKPLHNGTQVRHRHGRFGRSVQISAQVKDTVYRTYHRYKGSFSADTVFPKYTRIEPDKSLLPLRKPEELEFDRMLIAKTDKKLEALGKKRTNYIYVIYNDSIYSEPEKVYSRTAWRQAAMPLEMKEVPHYLFHLYSNEKMLRIELIIDGDKRIPLPLVAGMGQYVCANYNGETKYFSTKESCEDYIQELMKTN